MDMMMMMMMMMKYSRHLVFINFIRELNGEENERNFIALGLSKDCIML